ncbi:MAG: peptidoglycan bridge formation glycyltransferase FemA/FemB family protein [Bacteroidales bacterium]|nr:peptidoglycan bridge formation glycyltransferase FemA/FemB family protein [Bacteroidales bacterium]
MSKEIKVYTSYKDINCDSWSDLVQLSSVASWFQTPEAYCFFDSLTFLDAFCVAVETDGVLKGVVVGYIQKDGGKLKQFLSRRAIINGGPLLAYDITDEELVALLGAVKNHLKRKAIYIETRNFNDYSEWRPIFESNGFVFQPHYDVVVETASVESVNKKLDRNRKRNLKKAIDNGLIIESEPNDSDIEAFYAQLQKLYSTKVKVPLYPIEFFIKLAKQNSSRFFLAKNNEGLIIGGLVCVVLTSKSVYAWYACGEDAQYKNLFPSVMVNYAGICYAAENNIPKFDFMGAGKPDDGGYGVRDFKLKFGGELVEYGRYDYICNRLLYNIGKLGVKLLKKL